MPMPYGVAPVPALHAPPAGRDLPIVVHVPRASRWLPPWVRRLPAERLAALCDARDRLTDDLLDRAYAIAPYLGYSVVVNQVSPLAADPDRPRDEAAADCLWAPDAAGDPDPSLWERQELARAHDDYRAAVREAVWRAIGLHDQCLLLEAGTFEGVTSAGAQEAASPDVRVGTVAGNEPEWMLSPLREIFDEGRLPYFTLGPDETGGIARELQAEFGDRLVFARIELGRRSYLDLEDGRCYAPWRGGPDTLHFVLTRTAHAVDARSGYPRDALTREQALAYARVWRASRSDLPPVRDVVAWEDLENKPRVAMVKAREMGDCWITLFERSPDLVPGAHSFEIFHRVTGEHEFIGVRYDEP